MQESKKTSCTPCHGGMEKLSDDVLHALLTTVALWQLSPDKMSIIRHIHTKNFLQAFALVSEVARVAEIEQHHPDIAFGWGYATFTLTTHAIKGLHHNDFILARHIDALAHKAGLA